VAETIEHCALPSGEGTGLTFEQMLEQAGELDYSERSSGGMMTYPEMASVVSVSL
jgi:hypothetical protein